MALHASAKLFNLKASIEKYLDDSFTGATAFPGQVAAANWAWESRKLDTSGLTYFVRPTLRPLDSPYYKLASTAQAGYLRSMLLMIEVYAKRASYDTSPAIIEKSLDMLRAGFYLGTGITIKDYAGASATLGKAWVRGCESLLLLPEDQWLRGRLDVTLEWSEELDVAA
jgi:hypothetical protein